MRDDSVYELTLVQRVLVLIMVVLGTTIYTATILISSALLPQLQGALSATQDEISWVMTFNIVATAVATPTTGWIAARFGRRATMFWCSLFFSLATLMCGAANSLEELVLWRVVQGAFGAPLVPLGQTLLLDSFPRRQHGAVISIYGMANMIGPAIGPMFAGEIAEAYGWRWGFWMVLPLAAITVIGLRLALPPDRPEARVRLDWMGFLTLSVAIAAAQLVFSRGQRLDWFDSGEIIVATFLAAMALYMFIVHSLTAEKPFVSVRLMTDRNYGLGLVLVTLYGMLNFAPIVLLPPLLQQHAGFPDSAIGTMIGWRGIGAGIGFFIAMFMDRVDARVNLIFGSFIQVATGAWLMTFDLNVSPFELNANSCLQGIAIGVSWVPLTVITFSTLAPEHRAEAMSMFHLLRNFGSSLFISVAVAEIVRASAANYARMTEFISPHNRVLEMPWAMGAWSIETLPGLAKLANEIARQAAMIGYVNAFVLYTVVSAAVIPLCLLARMPRAAPRAA
jgi:DHA2 family multidrug resistance protein